MSLSTKPTLFFFFSIYFSCPCLFYLFIFFLSNLLQSSPFYSLPHVFFTNFLESSFLLLPSLFFLLQFFSCLISSFLYRCNRSPSLFFSHSLIVFCCHHALPLAVRFSPSWYQHTPPWLIYCAVHLWRRKGNRLTSYLAIDKKIFAWMVIDKYRGFEILLQRQKRSCFCRLNGG